MELIALVCLSASFFLTDRKRRMLSVLQAVVGAYLFFILLFFSPAPLCGGLLRELIGLRAYSIFRTALTMPVAVGGFSFSSFALVAIVLVAIAVWTAVRVAKRLLCGGQEEAPSVFLCLNVRLSRTNPPARNKIYLQYCRLLD